MRDLYDLPITTASEDAATAYRRGMELTLSAWPGAMEAFAAAIAADPDFALARSAIATVLVSQQRHEEARSEITRAIEQLEREGTAREKSHVHVVALVNAGNRSVAIEAAKHHVEQWPRDATVLSFLLGAYSLLAFSGMPDQTLGFAAGGLSPARFDVDGLAMVFAGADYALAAVTTGAVLALHNDLPRRSV